MKLIFFMISLFLLSCTANDHGSGKYVKPSIDYKGRFRKGNVRMPVSTDKDAIKNQNRSKYYYESRGKYRRQKKK